MAILRPKCFVRVLLALPIFLAKTRIGSFIFVCIRKQRSTGHPYRIFEAASTPLRVCLSLRLTDPLPLKVLTLQTGHEIPKLSSFNCNSWLRFCAQT